MNHDEFYSLLRTDFDYPDMGSVKSKEHLQKYSKVAISSSMSGAEVARKILDDNGLFNVAVEEVRGQLSDHYDPRSKVVRLSTDNFHGRSAAGAAVAAHEVGHAIQDAQDYAFYVSEVRLYQLRASGQISLFS